MPRSSALASLVAVALGIVALGSGPAATGLEPSSGASTEGTAEAVEPLLDEPMRGRAAVAELGDQLAVAATRNELRPAELRTLLRTDSTVWVDRHQ